MKRVQHPIRICFVIDNLSRAGTETQLLLLMRNLNRSQIEPHLCLLNGESKASRLLEPADVPCARLGLQKLLSIKGIRAAFRFKRYLLSNKIDVVQTYFPDSTRFAAPIARLTGCKVAGSRRNIGHWMRGKDKWVARIINKFFVSHVVVNSEAVKQAVVEQEGVSLEAVTVIPNGIDVESFSSSLTWSPKSGTDSWKIGMVGNLRKVKGPDLFVRMARIVVAKKPHVQFVIAGDGDQKKYQNLIDDLNLTDKVKLLGSVSDVPRLLSTLDVAVLPSRAEGFSGALLEYMVAGRPIVATKVGGNVEIIEYEVNGLLVNSEDEKSLAQAILRLMNDASLAKRLAGNARKDSKKFDASRMAKQYTKTIQNKI